MKKCILIFLFFSLVFSLYAISFAPYKRSDYYLNVLSEDNSVTMYRKKFTRGLYNLMNCEYSGNSNYDKYYNYYALYNLDNNYREFKCIVGVSDNAKDDKYHSVSFYVDGNLIKKVTVKKGQKPQEVTINLAYRRQLKVSLEGKCVVANIDFR